MRYSTGVALVLMAALLWSVQPLIIRGIDSAGAWTILFWRSMGMLPAVFLYLAWRTGGAPLRAIRRLGAAGVLGGLGLVAAMGGAILAFQTTTIANAVFLFAASPFLAALMGRVLLGEPVPARTWTAIALALVGIFIMVRDGLAAGALLGNVAGLISALGFAAFTVSLRWRKIEDSLPASVLGAMFSLVAGGVVALSLGQPLAVDGIDIAASILMGMGTLAGGMILYTQGSKVVPSGELALLSNLEVLLAPLWVWLVLDEATTPGTALGGAVLLAAILYNALARPRHAAPV